jgi:leader peptidase (prepilin peptidase) / N-methyltransferase
MPIRLCATFFAALAGLAFGSFLNVCLTRWPAGESIVKPRSHCRACGRTLAWWENIPLLSWITLRGRCRTCGAWIGIRYPLVELAVGVIWGLVAWRSFDAFFPAEFAAGMMFFTWSLIALATLDAEYLWLPDALTLPSVAIGFCWWFLQRVQIGRALRILSEPWQDAEEAGKRLLAILAAALLILLIRWTYKLIRKREGIGLGDAKLMAMLAAWLGLPGALLSFFIGVVLGALVALVVLALPSKSMSAVEENSAAPGWWLRKLPLGTFLCIGGIVSALWGQSILAAYLRWAGF